MLRRIVCSSALLVGIAALYFFHVRIKPDDLPFYRKIVQESADLHAHSALEKLPVRQMRKGVRKDIWTIQDGGRVHGRVECLQSDLTLTPRREKMEAIEILHGIEACIDVGEENKRWRAESGTCYFPSCRLEAQHLVADFEPFKCTATESHATRDLVQFLGPFHIEHPVGRIFGEKGTLTFQGAAHHLQFEEGVLFEAAHAPFSIFSMSAETDLFSAEEGLNGRSSSFEFEPKEIQFSGGVEIQPTSGIRAVGGSAVLSQNSLRLFPEPGLTCQIHHRNNRIEAKEFQFDRDSNEILCLSPHGYLEDERAEFEAETGHARLVKPSTQLSDKEKTGFIEKGFLPQTLILEGNVRIASLLQEKKSFAMADSAQFYLDQRKIVLASAPSSRVFFKQEGLEISAPIVHIQEAIQGFGDVRFFFYPEETTALDAIFSKYL